MNPEDRQYASTTPRDYINVGAGPTFFTDRETLRVTEGPTGHVEESATNFNVTVAAKKMYGEVPVSAECGPEMAAHDRVVCDGGCECVCQPQPIPIGTVTDVKLDGKTVTAQADLSIAYLPRPEWYVPNPFESAKPSVQRHAFNRAVSTSLGESLEVSDQRAGEYSDTWAVENLTAPRLGSILREIAKHQYGGDTIDVAALTPEEIRLIVVASLADVKTSRYLGPWKDDTPADEINYLAALKQWMREYLEGV